MNLEVAANAHRQTRACVDPVQAGLSPAPHAEPGRELPKQRPGDGQPAVDEEVATMKPDDPALHVGVEAEAPRQRLLVQPAFEEQSEGAAPTAVLADRLAPLGGEPDGDAGQRV